MWWHCSITLFRHAVDVIQSCISNWQWNRNEYCQNWMCCWLKKKLNWNCLFYHECHTLNRLTFFCPKYGSASKNSLKGRKFVINTHCFSGARISLGHWFFKCWMVFFRMNLNELHWHSLRRSPKTNQYQSKQIDGENLVCVTQANDENQQRNRNMKKQASTTKGIPNIHCNAMHVYIMNRCHFQRNVSLSSVPFFPSPSIHP